MFFFFSSRNHVGSNRFHSIRDFLLLFVPSACMVRRGWTQIEVPQGWTQVIHGRQDSSQRIPSAASPKGRSQPDVKSTSAPESKVGRFEAALKVMGEEQSEARTALEEALRKAKAEGPRRSAPQDRMAEVSARVTRLKSSVPSCWARTVWTQYHSTLRWNRHAVKPGSVQSACVSIRVCSSSSGSRSRLPKHRTENNKPSQTGCSTRRSWRKVCGMWRFCGSRSMRSRSHRLSSRDSPVCIPLFK